ncbi:GrpB family protein [Alkalibacillus haloalkaliphilus]|uniref:GrpB family protein n=1 Tax=Alkalibacillus haloalkaliphilus TaxID=94136 RepID=UPI002935C328|nr:GrpB family protein [Alkalibacillus haloalkaliphilus]MDV2582052.1 GrpB family protein [Alkalibacillus haloalkaliphilus]
MRKIEVVPYQNSWPEMYEIEATKLKSLLSDEYIDIYHIGSTSVPGLKAKPIIDILMVVKAVEAVDLYNEQLINIGFIPKGENGIEGRRFFIKGGDNRSHHLHIFQTGSADIKRHIAFRDYLIHHPQMSGQYGDLKERLSRLDPYDSEAYVQGKEQMVQEIERLALEWGEFR